MSHENKETRTKEIRKLIVTIGFTLFAFVGTALGIFFGLHAFIDKQISFKLRDPEVIKQIAYLIRPSLIFDQNGTFEIDNGAAQFIKDISVEKDQKGEVQKVIVSPKETLNIQPLLTCLNGTIYFAATRQKADWIFQVVGPDYVSWHSSKVPEKYLFELQIVR